MQDLYRDAVSTTRIVKETRDAIQNDAPDVFVESVKKVRAELFDEIVDNASEKIMAAATKGLSAVDLFNFNGNDSRDGVDDASISVLFVIKGHRAHAIPPPPGTPGPLLPDLQAALAPFVIVHDWDGISGGNRIVARWA
jgi:hypothetical protein